MEEKLSNWDTSSGFPHFGGLASIYCFGYGAGSDGKSTPIQWHTDGKKLTEAKTLPYAIQNMGGGESFALSSTLKELAVFYLNSNPCQYELNPPLDVRALQLGRKPTQTLWERSKSRH